MEFVEPEDEPNQFRDPLPPDDRLWRHPSEIGAGIPGGDGFDLAPASPDGRPGDLAVAAAGGGDARPSLWLVAAVSAVSAGLIASGLGLVVVGLLGTNDQLRPAVERQMEPRPIDAVTTGSLVDVAAQARAAVAQLHLAGAPTAVGSGVIFRSDGHMLTSASVVGEATSLQVTLDNGRQMTGRVIGTDPDTDVAVVKIDGAGPFPTAVLGRATDLQVGQQAVAIGWPVGLMGGPSVTVGVVSALHRAVRRSDGGMLFDMVQTDARVPTGWPGGALLDSSGSVIGITTAVGTTATATDASTASATGIGNGTGAGVGNGTGSPTGGFGFAVPIDLARSVAGQLIANGRVTAVWLGVQGGDLDWLNAAGLEVAGGAVVGEVKRASPAERAGLAEGDVIVGLDDQAVTSMGHLVVALRQHAPGDAVRLDIMRDQQRMSMTVVLTERPAPA